MTYLRKISLSETNTGGRLRTSNQRSQIGYLQSLEKDTKRFDEVVNGTATSVYEGNGIGSVNMTVATLDDYVIRKGTEANYYYPGTPLKIELTCSKFQNQANIIKRMGYFSSSTTAPYNTVLDGFTFESDGTEHYVRVYRAGTLVWELPKAQWKRQDKVANWNPENFVFGVIEFLYLGGAIVQFKLNIAGELITIAEYTHVGVDINTFVKSPNQPIRYEIRSTLAAATGEFNHICGDVASEGLDQNISLSRAANNGAVLITGLSTNTRYALLGLRLQSNALLQVADVYGISVLAGTADNLLVELFLGGSLVSSPGFVDQAGTIMSVMDGQGATVADLVHSGGVRLIDFYMSRQSSKDQILQDSRRLGSLIDGTPEEIYVCVTPVSANAGVLVSVNWKEFI